MEVAYRPSNSEMAKPILLGLYFDKPIILSEIQTNAHQRPKGYP
jgi:hypothetical protein